MTEEAYWKARAEADERHRKLREEIRARHPKGREFLERMQYIQTHNFEVQTVDERPGFVVVVTEKTLSEKRTTIEE